MRARLHKSRLFAALISAPLLGFGLGQDASAQSGSLPGLIVTVPPSGNPAPPAEPQPAPPAVEKRAPKPAKPKTASRPPANARSGAGAGSRGSASHKIKLLVNDDPITNYEIDARARLLALRANIGDEAKKAFGNLIRNPQTNDRLKAIFEKTVRENQGKSRDEVLAIFERRKQAFAQQLQQQALTTARRSLVPQFKKKAEQELIEERLKLQAAQQLNIAVDEERVESIFAGIAKGNKLSPDEFAKQIRQSGSDPEAMKARFRAGVAWSMVLQRKFGALISVNQREVDEFVGNQTASGSEQLALHKVTLDVPASMDQTEIARLFQSAETMRGQFQGCSSTKAVAASLPGARFQDLGNVNSDKIAEPTRSMLLAADTNEMLPPNVGKSGIVLYAVCGKTSSSGDEQQERAARAQLQERELDVLGRRYLADLKRDAHIEHR